MGSMRWTAVALLLLCTLPQLHTAPDDVRPRLQSTSNCTHAQLPCPKSLLKNGASSRRAAACPPNSIARSHTHFLDVLCEYSPIDISSATGAPTGRRPQATVGRREGDTPGRARAPFFLGERDTRLMTTSVCVSAGLLR